MNRAILDFPQPGAAAAPDRRLLFERPRRVVTADSLPDVLPALREVEAAAAAGAWAVGFVAYEAAPAFDTAFVTRPHEGPAPLLCFGLFDEPASAPFPVAPAQPPAPIAWHTSTARPAYDEAIRSIREGIAAGDVYQVNHTLRFRAAVDATPLALYDALTAPRHGLYHAYLETDRWAILSASPELFLERVGSRITTRPMKGTMRRGRWLEEDDTMARRLAASAKDRAENLMIVDLLRNDLGRVARFGTVEVPVLFAIETYPTVHQMTSTVTALLRPGASLCDVFAAMFPCGSVTGAPKIAAMKAIAHLEDAPRGPYCGAVGVVRPDGSAAFNVAIRTILLDRRSGVAMYGAGGGITWDSVADAEYDEVSAKASLLHHGSPEFELLETMRMDDGTIARLPLHLRRLADSARFWSFPPQTLARASRELERLRAQRTTGSWRLRLTASREGAVHISRTPLAEPPRALFDQDPRDAAPLPVALAAAPVHDADRLLFHKTTARSVYDERRAEHPDCFDVLLVNQHGDVTEFTTGNLVLDLDGRLLTPARSCGLLAGTLRQQLLHSGTIEEAVVPAHRVPAAGRLWHVNSVRGCTRVALRGSRGTEVRKRAEPL